MYRSMCLTATLLRALLIQYATEYLVYHLWINTTTYSKQREIY